MSDSVGRSVKLQKEIKTKQFVTERDGAWEPHIEDGVARSHEAVDA